MRPDLTVAPAPPSQRWAARWWRWFAHEARGTQIAVVARADGWRASVARWVALAAMGFGLTLTTGCEAIPEPVDGRTIEAVLAAHQAELMAKPGVVGVYVGLGDDGLTPCLKVMIRRADPTLERTLPRQLEGYRVVAEITGDIVPMSVATKKVGAAPVAR